MRNTECTVYISTKRGWTQSYRKEKNGWTQTCPNGAVRLLSAEQLLSHILPAIAANSDYVSIRVEPDPEVAARSRHLGAAQARPASLPG